ncbi:drebrin-like [Emys orbicularis]|uniref:drebrin-like n=1 Tax=Emys orbicularis TaxID=82168 RepID=UPI0031FBB28D
MNRLDLDTHRLALLAAKEDIGSRRLSADWAIFAYGKHNELKLLDSGAGGVDELAGKFSSSSVMYGLCRVQDPSSGQPRIILINWVGEKVPESYRQTCAGHLPAIKAFFKEASLVVSAHRPEEVTQEGLHRVLSRLAPAGGSASRRAPASGSEELVGTNYRKTNPALEIRRTKRDSFWAQAEREEEQRKEEERRRLLEERKRWERERMEEEKREAAERERKFKEKERLIEEQRKEQARLEAEERRKEKARWEQQQREHEEAMRDRFRRSESIEKAVEAATLVSQRSQNPREFFRQRERSSSTSGAQSPPSPLGVRPGAPHRPYLRYQRSLTESAYIFRRPEPPASPGDFLPAPSSPRPSESSSMSLSQPPATFLPTEEDAPCMAPRSLQGPSESSLVAELVPMEGPHGSLPDVPTGALADPTNPSLAGGEPAQSCPVLSSAGACSLEPLPQSAPLWPWHPGPSTAAAPRPGEDPVAGGEALLEPSHGPLLAPEASPDELLPESGHNGIAGQEVGRWPELRELEPEPGEKGTLSGSTKLQLQAAWDPPAGDTAWVSLQGGARRAALEGGEAVEGPSPRTA